MASSFKKEQSKIRSFNRNNRILMVEKGTRGGIYNGIDRYAKANNKNMKDYDKN